MTLFLSSLGLFSTIFLWPIPLCLHLLEVEKIENVPWLYLCISSALSVVFNLSINFGIAYTFPLFISIGTVIGIPLNAVVDQLFRNVSYLNWKFTATDLIVGGFLLMLLPPSDSRQVQKHFRQIIDHIRKK
jgi:solute carrier family 35 protein F3/4